MGARSSGGITIGDHTLLFAGERERIEIIRRAQSRQVFATGLIKSIAYVVGDASEKISGMEFFRHNMKMPIFLTLINLSYPF